VNLHLLRIFSAVAQNRSFSRAADALHISQPAVSKSIREFEAQLGISLLERGPRGVHLTEAGRLLIKHARDLFAAEQSAHESLDALRGLRQGTLRIGASTTIATYFLPPVLGAFYEMHPTIELHLTSANTSVIADLLMSREVDVALVEGPVEAADVIIKPWHEDELVFIAAISHPLVSRNPPIRVSDLAAEIIVMRERGSGTRDVAWDALLSTGWSPQRILEVSSNEAITRVVAAGLGIGIVSAAVAADHLALGRLRILSIEGLAIRRPLTRLILPDRQPSPATAAFNSLLDKGFPST